MITVNTSNDPVLIFLSGHLLKMRQWDKRRAFPNIGQGAVICCMFRLDALGVTKELFLCYFRDKLGLILILCSIQLKIPVSDFECCLIYHQFRLN